MTTDENAEHAEAMKAVQAKHRAKMKEKKKSDRGLLLVHTGNGKGKSTSAFGTILRALGWGHKVALVQFIKGTWKTGEKQFFAKYPDLITQFVMGQGFTWDTQDREQDMIAARGAWGKACELMNSGDYDLVVLDELNIALRYEYLPASEVVEGALARHSRTSVIITGRDAPQELMDAADLVTEMAEIKHPFQAGIKAKQGVDY